MHLKKSLYHLREKLNKEKSACNWWLLFNYVSQFTIGMHFFSSKLQQSLMETSLEEESLAGLCHMSHLTRSFPLFLYSPEKQNQNNKKGLPLYILLH